MRTIYVPLNTSNLINMVRPKHLKIKERFAPSTVKWVCVLKADEEFAEKTLAITLSGNVNFCTILPNGNLSKTCPRDTKSIGDGFCILLDTEDCISLRTIVKKEENKNKHFWIALILEGEINNTTFTSNLKDYKRFGMGLVDKMKLFRKNNV